MWGQNLGPEFQQLAASRSKWFIYPEFQLKVVAYGVSIAALAGSIAYGASKYVFWKSLDVLKEAGLPMSHPVFAFLLQQEQTFDGVFLVLSTVGLFFSFMIGVRLSHRIAGPVLRLKHHLERSASGAAPAKLVFRDGDYFQDLADAYNRDLESRGRPRRPGSELNRKAS